MSTEAGIRYDVKLGYEKGKKGLKLFPLADFITFSDVSL